MNYSYWELDTIYGNYDLVIIGAGFTGLWSALEWREKFPKSRILIVEKNSYPLGASTRNAGFACFGSITEILADAAQMGWTQAINLVEKRFFGLQILLNKIEPTAIDYATNGGYELLNQKVSMADVENINSKIKAITGLDKTYQLDNDAKKKFNFGNFGINQIIKNPLEGGLHPGKLLNILIRRCYANNINFLWNKGLLSFKSKSDHVELNLRDLRINTEKLLICTNGFTPDLLPNLDVKPARGQVLLTSEIKNLKVQGVFHSDEGYIYFRNVGKRILLGGMRNLDAKAETSAKFESNPSIIDALQKYLKEVILPEENFEITHQWQGIMAMGMDKNYLLQKVDSNVVMAVRLSGMGVALAPQIAKETVELF